MSVNGRGGEPKKQQTLTVNHRAHQLLQGLAFAVPGRMVSLNAQKAHQIVSLMAQYDLLAIALLGTFRQIDECGKAGDDEGHLAACEALTRHMNVLSRVCSQSTGVDFGGFDGAVADDEPPSGGRM